LICFAILAHNNEAVLANQIRNIKRYNPGCMVVLYNGGKNPGFGRRLGISVCPYSRPLRYGRLGRFFYDVMRWLERRGIRYDYLVNVDSDLMFVKPGFEPFLNRVMKGYGCMGIRLKAYRSLQTSRHWIPARTMWREWKFWQPFFQMNHFYGTLNTMQVYRRSVVQRMLRNINRVRLEHLFQSTKVFALEEILYVTLAARSKSRLRAYPAAIKRYVRLGRPLSAAEANRAKRSPLVFFVHPVKRTMSDPALRWITHH
jgi:hypothetical protein